MKLQLVGCSHHNATVELRERVAFSQAQASEALDCLRERFPHSEAVLLSTCNRVEIYTAAEDPIAAPTHQDVAAFLAEFHGMNVEEIFDDLFERTGEDAVHHLFMVAASLDSMVIGEPQILSQVKQAYDLAKQCRSTGPLTHLVFQAALKVARRVARETTINEKRVSIPSVAIGEFASQVFERFDDKQVLVIGAGEMADESIRYLRQEGVSRITVVNRHLQRAQQLAAEWQGTAQPWEQLFALLVDADLVVSTTGAPEPVVTRDQFRRIEADRYQRPLFVLDLAVPRDFEPEVGGCLGVYLYGVDDLRETCERNRRERRKEWPAAERIIETESRQFMSDLNHRATAPTIRRLKSSYQRLRDEELRRLFNKRPDLDAATQEDVARSFERLINKLLHPPLESLRDEARHGVPHSLLEAIKRLFQLKD